MDKNKQTIRFALQQLSEDTNTAILVGCIRYLDLRDKVRFTFRNYDDNEPPMDYQRRIDMKRVKNIAKYIEKAIAANLKREISPIFPTSIVLSFSNQTIDFPTIGNNDFVEISNLSDDILIVDGQHRFAAFDYLYDKLKNASPTLFYEKYREEILKFIENYKFNCSILLNYDIWEQAKVFASVNFNQKKVNKSLFYDIYGIRIADEEAVTIPKQNEIYLAHQLVEYLNSGEESPLKGFVNMLGVGKGFVSQAFLVEQFLKMFSTRGIWNDVAEDIKIGESRGLQNYAKAELYCYFRTIMHVFQKYWPKEGDSKISVLCKTTGIGALLQFMRDIHNTIDSQKLRDFKNAPNAPENVLMIINAFLNNLIKLSPYQDELFSSGEDGKFNGTGGEGLQRRLYRRIKEIWKS